MVRDKLKRVPVCPGAMRKESAWRAGQCGAQKPLIGGFHRLHELILSVEVVIQTLILLWLRFSSWLHSLLERTCFVLSLHEKVLRHGENQWLSDSQFLSSILLFVWGLMLLTLTHSIGRNSSFLFLSDYPWSITGVKCHFYHIISKFQPINMMYHCWPWLPGWHPIPFAFTIFHSWFCQLEVLITAKSKLLS